MDRDVFTNSFFCVNLSLRSFNQTFPPLNPHNFNSYIDHFIGRVVVPSPEVG